MYVDFKVLYPISISVVLYVSNIKISYWLSFLVKSSLQTRIGMKDRRVLGSKLILAQLRSALKFLQPKIYKLQLKP